MALNKVIILGRITQDLELKQTPNGVSVLSFTVAVDRSYAKQGEERQSDFKHIRVKLYPEKQMR